MIDTKHTLACVAILALATTAWGYEGQDEDEQVVQEAMEQGIIDSHPFPLLAPWADWVNNCGDLLSYRSLAVSQWQEVAEATNMTPEQRDKARALHEKFREVHEAFDETTTPPRHKLLKRAEQAKKDGNKELADKLVRLGHVQTHQKLAIQGGASEDVLRLLTPEQLTEWHHCRVSKHAQRKMKHHIYKRVVNDEDLDEALNLTGAQKHRIEAKAWQIARKDFLPTVEHPEHVSAFDVYGEPGKRAIAMGHDKLYPWMVENVLNDMQRAKLAFANQRWHVTSSPTGGVHSAGEKVNVELSFQTNGQDEGVQIRYTLDGSKPTADSKLYKQPLAITRDTTLRARCFLDGKLLPGQTATARFALLGDGDQTKPGLGYHLYHGSWGSLPQFADLKPVKTGVASDADLEVSDRGDRFALVFEGYLDAPKAGEYTFFTTSDDGSALHINGQKVVDNDGVHGAVERSGKIRLTEGKHLIRIEYFEAGGGHELQVLWQGPGIDKQLIPAELLSH